jgi:hypothetical protein
MPVMIVYECRPLGSRGPDKVLQWCAVGHGAVETIQHPHAAELWRCRLPVPRIPAANLRRFRQRAAELGMMLVLFARHEDV